MADTTTTRKAAEAYVSSYAAAVSLSPSTGSTVEEIAQALASHWHPGAVVFVFGQIVTFPLHDKEAHPWYTTNLQLLKRFEKSELGYRVELVRSRVEVYSEGAAQCWITWRSVPREGGAWEGKGWEWENIYGWRRAPGDEQGKGHWEYVVSDHEMMEMRKRIPDFYELEA
ncbi:Hypothetical protein D9617_15g041720 [Elsinoe fawcettii]|nr:Hypothetical protein D9617_15g041720 [Elsinoe fawcettii]